MLLMFSFDLIYLLVGCRDGSKQRSYDLQTIATGNPPPLPTPMAQPFVKPPNDNDQRILRSRYMGVDRQFVGHATTYTQCFLRVIKNEATEHKLIQAIEVEIERKLIRIIDPNEELTWLEEAIDVVFTGKCSSTFNLSNGLVILSAYLLETFGDIAILRGLCRTIVLSLICREIP